jgi:SAM-dependent methyltransferase
VAVGNERRLEHLFAPEYADEVWRKRRQVATDHVIPWLGSLTRLSGSTVVEYGCGTGAVSCAFGPVVGHHIGYDIDPAAINLAEGHVKAHEADNVELHAVEADQILDAVREHRGEVDLMLLYAVIEHMTVSERLELLETALEVVKDDGLIAVVETPNRLVWPDWHTSFLPFFSQLPDELALAYFDRSPRADFKGAIADAARLAPEAAEEALIRWGRGASFHEFELVFGQLEKHVIAGGFEPHMFPERPVRWEELALARELERSRPDLPPAFGRYWIDLVLSPQPVDPRTIQFIWPWPFETTHSPAARWTKWDSIALEAQSPLIAQLPCTTGRVITTVTLSDTSASATLAAGGAELSRTVAGEPDTQITIDWDLPYEDARVSLTLDRPGVLNFLGYQAPSQRPDIG